MTFTEFALRMFPYWILGWFILYATYKSEYRSLLRIEPKAVGKWVLFLGGLTIYRYIVFRMAWQTSYVQDAVKATAILPWQACFTVFWEDAAHTLPLVLLRQFIGTSKKTWPLHAIALVAMMVDFGSGHLYQGPMAAIMLSFYIPMTIKYGKKYGFGTVMICHCLYDLSTILLIQNMWRLM